MSAIRSPAVAPRNRRLGGLGDGGHIWKHPGRIRRHFSATTGKDEGAVWDGEAWQGWWTRERATAEPDPGFRMSVDYTTFYKDVFMPSPDWAQALRWDVFLS